MIRVRGLGAVLLIGVLVAAGCGGGDERPQSADGATPARAAPERETTAGRITYCAPRLTRFSESSAVESFNAGEGGGGPRVRIRWLPDAADERRDRLVAGLESGCDVAVIETVWLAEFAASGLVQDMTGYVGSRREDFVQPALSAARWAGRYWAVPRSGDAGVLYRRADAGGEPRTWQEVYERAEQGRGLVYQGARSDTLVVHFLELAYAAGARVLSDDGRRSTIDGAAGRRALELMRSGIENGAVSRAVAGYQEEESRKAFGRGQASFMRNWSYAAVLLGQSGSALAGRFDASALPAFAGGGRAAVFSGTSLVLGDGVRDRDAALALVDHLTTEASASKAAIDAGVAPVVVESLDDSAVVHALPAGRALRRSILMSRPLPVTPAYFFVSRALRRNVHAALTGRRSPRQALKAADRSIQRGLNRTAAALAGSAGADES